MTHAAPDNGDSTEITSPPSKTAGEQDHSDPWQYAGEDADAPGNAPEAPINASGGERDGQGPEGEI